MKQRDVHESYLKMIVCIAVVVVLSAGCACPNFPQPSWYRKLPASQRFVLVLEDQAALDKETGLVWQRAPSTELLNWREANAYCLATVIAKRKGWRLPSYEELTSLMDNTVTQPALPVGHPFLNVDPTVQYWTSTDSTVPESALTVTMLNFSPLFGDLKTVKAYHYWCVRGGVAYRNHF